jgi:hypothetical protein
MRLRSRCGNLGCLIISRKIDTSRAWIGKKQIGLNTLPSASGELVKGRISTSPNGSIRKRRQALRDGNHAEVGEIAKHVLRSTNLVFRIEKAKFTDAIEGSASLGRFANALFDLLHGSAESEGRFTSFCDILSEIGVNKWTIATYYQFLATDGKWMFMKPSIMKRMADSLKIALNYNAEPNWLTYSKLQELGDRVDVELRNRGLNPRSRIDVQGFIWASIGIEEGSYGKAE